MDQMERYPEDALLGRRLAGSQPQAGTRKTTTTMFAVTVTPWKTAAGWVVLQDVID